METRKQRALKRTLIMAIFLIIPVGVLIYFKVQNHSQDRLSSHYKVRPFYLQTSENMGFSLSDLRNKVTLLALIPAKCLTQQEINEALYRSQKWANEQLGSNKSKPFQLVALTEGQIEVPHQWTQIKVEDGQVFQKKLDPFLEGEFLPQELSLVFIDQNAVVTGVFSYSGIEDWKEIEALWSKLVFNHYLSDYLSKRTFFGPKREHSFNYH
ncbi:MAG: hypothetical protein AB8G05_14450 [Oligoflexales bacterium]